MRGDLVADRTIPIGEVGGDVEHPLVPRLHETERFRPAGNHLGNTEGGRLTTINGTIEDSPIPERATVVDADGVVEGGGYPRGRTRGQHLVTQAAGPGDPTGGVWGGGCRGGGTARVYRLGCWGRSSLLRLGLGLARGDQDQGGGGEEEGKFHG